MNKLQQTYFFRLFKENKWLFVFVLLFIVCQHFFYLKKNNCFPWYVWNMYSYPEYKPDTLTQVEFYIDGERLNLAKIPIWQEATIQHTFNTYFHLYQHQYIDNQEKEMEKIRSYIPISSKEYWIKAIANDSINTKQFPTWFINYLEQQIVHHKINEVTVKTVAYKYTPPTFSKTQKSSTLITFKK
ncbi:MAG: hypothetical protein KDD21_09825 [Bacteroidetes bacterium]|nr:hypothetical protein [Bacteroidota bacterium]